MNAMIYNRRAPEKLDTQVIGWCEAEVGGGGWDTVSQGFALFLPEERFLRGLTLHGKVRRGEVLSIGGCLHQ